MSTAMDHFAGRAKKIALSYLLLSLVVLITWWRLPDMSIASFGVRQQLSAPMDELETALNAAASMENRTLIISVLNKAYIGENGMLDLFLQSLREGEGTQLLIKHLLLVTADEASFDRCRALRLNCYRLAPANGTDLSQEQLFMSDGFIEMMWQRIRFLGTVLKRGYSFVFTDMDIIWLKNPFEKLIQSGDDLQISCDAYNGQPFNDSNAMNTGFYFVQSNNRTVELFDSWYALKRSPMRMNDQFALFILKKDGVFKQLGMKVRYLDTRYIGGFCQHGESLAEMATLHANCCRTMSAKVADLTTVWESWKRSNGAATRWRWPPLRACFDSWRQNLTHT